MPGKYLKNHAEPEISSIPNVSMGYGHSLVIPAYNEALSLLTKVENLPQTTNPVLVILVVNSPTRAQGSGPRILNPGSRILEYVNTHYQSTNKNLYSVPNSKNELLLIDRFSSGKQIPEKQGVGLARKIGCDIACKLIHQGNITSPWIHTTDADVTLPNGYFNVTAPQNTAAILYPFKHTPASPELTKPIKQYETSLHYYVEQLKWAGSPYAFHTIGSTMTIHYDYYAKVRGFPKRAGGEDFYILNKLKKLGNIHTLLKPTLTIEARESNRVPFGTGPALTKLKASDQLFYHPKVFIHLKQLLNQLPSLYTSDLQTNNNTPHLAATLTALNFEQALSHARKHSSNPHTFTRHIHNWFDAFKTLKFIHHLRNHHYPSIPYSKLRAKN